VGEPTENSRIGRYIVTAIGGETVRAYVPPPLPPMPPINLESLLSLLEEANHEIGRLDGISAVIADVDLFLYMYTRKEAVLSSQIEGTQSSLSDLLLFEADEIPGAPLDDVREVSRYVAALTFGLTRLREDFPLSLRLVREMHEILLRDGRGADRSPGEFRRTQNWIGGTRPGNAVFVPPPVTELLPCLSDLEKFLHDAGTGLPILITAGLAHVQFETIHPFLDGNGRLGRLLITLMLCNKRVLSEPLLYLSLYFKTYRDTYYDLLQRVRERGEWEAWLEFFLIGIRDTSRQAIATARRLLALFDEDRAKIAALGRAAASALRVHEELRRDPVVSVSTLSRRTGLSYPTVIKAIQHLTSVKITREATGRQRGRLFIYDRYLAILAEGTEPLPR